MTYLEKSPALTNRIDVEVEISMVLEMAMDGQELMRIQILMRFSASFMADQTIVDIANAMEMTLMTVKTPSSLYSVPLATCYYSLVFFAASTQPIPLFGCTTC
jgi:hypothetical protein